ncbi:MAG: UDP-N-acetylglucosamine 2-epimerase (non-hydrolyzing) [Armatimonadota bacterium]
MASLRVMLVAGARPNFMKVAPIWYAIQKRGGISVILVHTGQHYDPNMSDVFFAELGLPQPDEFLGVGSGTHAEQTARVMLAFEPVLEKYKPDVVVVVGDVNSTLACALVAVKRGVKVAHVEAGLRSGDRTMPEEINRIATDAISDYLFTPSRDADANLLGEGIPAERIFFVGNVMVDTLLAHREKAIQHSSILQQLDLGERQYAVITLHRPSNVDSEEALHRMVEVILAVQKRLPVVLPLHPRTRSRLGDRVKVLAEEGVILLEPLGYLDFLRLMCSARVVLTDSGGIQEETTMLGVPCLTMRENTERPVTLTQGTNHLVGASPEHIITSLEKDVLSKEEHRQYTLPEGWDGHAAERIVDTLIALWSCKY